MYSNSSQPTAELLSVLSGDNDSVQLLVDLGDDGVDIQRKYGSSLPDCEKLINAGLITPINGRYRLTDFGKVVRECVLEIADLALCFEVIETVAPILPKWNKYDTFPEWEALDSVEVIQGRHFEPNRPSCQIIKVITESEKTPRIVNANKFTHIKDQIPDCVDPEFVSLPSEAGNEPLNRFMFAETSSGGYLYIWAGDDRSLQDSVLLVGTPDGEFTAWVADRIEEWQAP